jgi:type VI secretion system Hcp family effector
MNSRKIYGIIALAMAVGIFGAARIASAAAVDYFLKIEGTKQGKFKGEGAMAERLPCSGFKYEASESSGAGAGKATSKDVASGQPTGRRMHGTITIVREIDKASPLFARAMSTGETLGTVDLEFVHNGLSANPEVYKTLHLSNAMITSIRPAPSSGGDRPMESITISAEIENIVAKDKNGNKAGIDSWSATK